MKKLSLSMIVVFSLLLIGCGNTKNVEENNVEQNAIVTENQNKADFNKSDCMKGCEMVWNKEGTQEQMLGDCEALCKAGEAMETNDASGCEEAEGMLKDSCYSSVAYETANPDLCEKLTDGLLKYGCYTSIAEKTKNIDICDKIDDKTWKMSCEIGAKSK